MDKKVFEPIDINGMRLKNRLGFAPILASGEVDGSIDDNIIRWFEQKAKGGTGLIMTGAVFPSAAYPGLIRGMVNIDLYDDKYIPGFAKLAEVIHRYGAKLGVQLALPGPFGGLGPSLPPYPDERHAKLGLNEAIRGRAMPVKEVSLEEIEQFELDCAAAAARAKAAGIDCVELHCAHGGATLHCSFISPFYNKRTDEYGGDWERRLRFPIETIQKMREAVGPDYPIIVRLSADELLGEKGITPKDTTEIIVPALERAAVDCFDVSQGSIVHSPEGIQIPLFYPRGCFIHLAEAVKRVTRLPVIGVGRIVDLDMAEKFLQEGKADIIYLGRQLIADPETPNKYLEGRLEDIRKCIGCLDGCNTCAINYDARPDSIPLIPAERPKRVLVIGGGIGGMEAVRIAALRGHKVTLMEKEPELGGMVAALALTPLTTEFGNIVDYLGNQMRKLRIDVRVCKEATIADVEELAPDVVIVAIGSSLVLPEVTRGKPGVMTHIEALRRKREIGNKVVIWGLVATELAISLAQEGKDVIIMGRGGEDTLARDAAGRRTWIFRKLTDINVVRETPEAARMRNPQVKYYVDVEEITPEGIRIADGDGKRRVLPYDTFIISRERVSNDFLFEDLQGRVAEVYKIGDCSQVGDIKDAIRSANELARRI